VKRHVILLAVVIITGFGNIADADLVDSSFDCNFPGDPHMYRHEWSVNYGLAELTITETFVELGPDVAELSGETDSASTTFSVIKKITNDTGITWTAYTLTLYDPMGEASFVEGSAGAVGSKFQTVAYPDATTIEFSGDDPVLDGHLVQLQLDIVIPTAGVFELTLTQNPVPEPATIALFGLGALMLLRRGKR
jgi:hypothetical protein